jgi:signal transduction histidine kinase
MKIYEIIQMISTYITIPLLLFMGWIVAIIWRQLEKKYIQETKLREIERDIQKVLSNFYKEKLDKPTEIQAAMEIIKESYEVQNKKLQNERDDLFKKLASLNTKNDESINRLQALDKESYNLNINQQRIFNVSFSLFTNATIPLIDDIMTQVEWLKHQNKLFHPELENRAKDKLDDIESSISSMYWLFIGLNYKDISLNEIYANIFTSSILPVVSKMKKYAENRHVTINIKESKNMPNVNIDKTYMNYVIYVLIKNAIDYSHADKNVEIFYNQNKNDTIDINFSNQGLEIEENEKELVFEKYYRSKNAAQFNVTGLGLSLYRARAIINAHGGDLFLSKLKNPTIFTIRLKLDKEN